MLLSYQKINDVRHMAGQNSENCEVDPWTWKDTLARIQYIDTIIEQIVSGAILLNSCLLAAFGALNIVLHSTGLHSEREIIVQLAIIAVCFGGIATNAILAKNLARQEYIRQWYFCIFPDNKLPLMPPDEWLPKDEPMGILKKLRKTLNIIQIYIKNKMEKGSNQNSPKDKGVIAKKYTMDCRQSIQKAYKRLFICKQGNKGLGYCALWFYLLLIMTGVFLVFAVLSCLSCFL